MSRSENFKEDMAMEEKEYDTEPDNYKVGPLAMLTNAVQKREQMLINCRNNRKLFGRIKAFDRHFNMVLEDVKELWADKPKKGKEARIHDRFIPKLFLRGDTVILVLKNPLATDPID